eukprot:Pgem_evm1s9461
MLNPIIIVIGMFILNSVIYSSIAFSGVPFQLEDSGFDLTYFVNMFEFAIVFPAWSFFYIYKCHKYKNLCSFSDYYINLRIIVPTMVIANVFYICHSFDGTRNTELLLHVCFIHPTIMYSIETLLPIIYITYQEKYGDIEKILEIDGRLKDTRIVPERFSSRRSEKIVEKYAIKNSSSRF